MTDKTQTTPEPKEEFVMKGERYIFVRKAKEGREGDIELSQLKDNEYLFYPGFIYRNAGRSLMTQTTQLEQDNNTLRAMNAQLEARAIGAEYKVKHLEKVFSKIREALFNNVPGGISHVED